LHIANTKNVRKKKNKRHTGKAFAACMIDKQLCSFIYNKLIQISDKRMNNCKENQAKNSNRQFSEKEIQMAVKHMKRCSTLFMINEMQIKTTMKMTFLSIRFSII
jgi:hypothetical protein